MRWWLKILFVLSLIGILVAAAIAVYAIYTYKQIDELKSAVDEANSHPEDIQELSRGNCSVLPAIENRTLNVKEKATALCGNFAIKLILSRNITVGELNTEQLCVAVNEIDKPLAQIKEICASRMNMTAK